MQRRTALISAASVVAVVLTGATAVGANLGILSSADDSSIGQLDAGTPSLSVPESPVEMDSSGGNTESAGAAATTRSVSSGDDPSQEFDVAGAGIVRLESTDGRLRVADVDPAPGWTWTTVRRSGTEVTVAFASATGALDLWASLDGGDSIVARVEQPVVETVSAPAPSATTHDDRDDDFEDDDDHEDEDDDDEDDDEDDDDHEGEGEEHEGRDDDD